MTPIGTFDFTYEENGGYDAMTAAYVIYEYRGAYVRKIATIDLADFGQESCEPATDEQKEVARRYAAVLCGIK